MKTATETEKVRAGVDPVEELRRLVKEVKQEYPREMIEDVLDKKFGPEKHLIRYVLEVVG